MPADENATATAEHDIGCAKVPVPQITLIAKRDTPALMSKRISLDGEGKLKSDGSECRMVTGTAARAFAATASALAQIIANCRSNQAIALGALKAELLASVAVTIPSRLDQHPGAITRSRGYIDYQPGVPAWCLIDFDTKGMPDEVKTKIDAAGGMWNALLTVAPELASAARVSRASTSAGLSRSDTGEPIAGSNGMHHYVLVRDGGDIERFLKDLHDRCWLHGFGWHLIGGAGQLLDRSIVDRMVGFGERLCFEGAPVIVPPVTQDSAKGAPEAFEGDAIDTARAVLRLTEFERHRVSKAKAASAKALGKSATKARDKHDKALAEKISAKSGVPVVTALRLVKARHRGVLFSDVELEFDDLGVVTVGAVLADPDRFIGESLADPLEGVDYGRCKAMVMKGDDDALLIHSFAHGNGLYFLRHDLRSAKAAFAQAPAAGKVDHALAILGQAELEEDEFEEFVTLVSKTAGVGLRPLKARIKIEREKRKAKAREGFHGIESRRPHHSAAAGARWRTVAHRHVPGRCPGGRPERGASDAECIGCSRADRGQTALVAPHADGRQRQHDKRRSRGHDGACGAGVGRTDADRRRAAARKLRSLGRAHDRWILLWSAAVSACQSADGVFQERATHGPRDQHRSPRHPVGSCDRRRWTRSGYRAGPPHRSPSARLSARSRTDGGGDQAVLGLPFG
jgi:hypothetical protein